MPAHDLTAHDLSAPNLASTEEPQPFDPAEILRCMDWAAVHYLLRPCPTARRRLPPLDPAAFAPGEDDEDNDADVHLAQIDRAIRRIAASLRQHERCASRTCRRAVRCVGDPPDCWRNAPPPSEEEVALAKALFAHHSGLDLAELHDGDDTFDDDEE